MPILDQIILQEPNPFDSVSSGNFWTEEQQSQSETVESIHQEAITQIQTVLKHTIGDCRTRTILLSGDSGCGKSYLLSRLKKTLNQRAFFAYIEACSDTERIWRHILRHTVDSLMHVPEGEKESQLLLWLKGLSAYRNRSIKRKILGAKTNFIHELRSIYPAGIYQPRDFFAVLYELINNPDLYFSACDWLVGNSISEEELKALGVNSIVDSEEAARGIISNFGRISIGNQPIVLCFDQVEAATSSNGQCDLYAVFRTNTAFHNDNLKNFLVIVTIVQDIFRRCQTKIHLADFARVDEKIVLNQINLEQAKALWAGRLKPLHSQATSKPTSSIAPLKYEDLENQYPGGKANLRDSIAFGGKLYEEYRILTIDGGKDGKGEEKKRKAAFKLLWQDELNKTRDKISRIRQLSDSDLIKMLIAAMETLGVKQIQPRLLNGKYAGYSFSYLSGKSQKIGIFWNEDANMKAFCFAMKACQKLVSSNPNIPLKIIRAEPLGKPNAKGYQLYKQIFNQQPHAHITPDLDSVHYLKTYQKLINDAICGDLVLDFASLSKSQLEDLVRQTKVLHQCRLLQKLEIVETDQRRESQPPKPEPKIHNTEVKEFLFNLVTVHKLLGEQVLFQQAKNQFSGVQKAEIENMIKQLCKEQQISYFNPNAKPQERLLCLVPQKTTVGVKQK